MTIGRESAIHCAVGRIGDRAGMKRGSLGPLSDMSLTLIGLVDTLFLYFVWLVTSPPFLNRLGELLLNV
jgi:hypothetical protein